jgi:hypothetical protein
VLAPFQDFVWASFAPSKAKFFAWLLVQARVQSRASLLKNHIIVESEAACPICNAPRESATHIVLGCKFARAFWEAVGWQPPPPDADVKLLPTYQMPAAFGSGMVSTFVILCCWNLWKHRNAVVFRGDTPCLPLLLS